MLSQRMCDLADAILRGEDIDDNHHEVPIRRGDAIFTGEAADYPRDWTGFIGQQQAKEDLQVKIASAQARGVRLDHTLFGGGRGLGKTTLAHLSAAEMNVGLVVMTAPVSPEEFHQAAFGMNPHDILFVDEVHLLVKGNQARADWLLPWMLGGTVKTGSGQQRTPDVTLFAATTDPGKLPGTMLDRFMNTPEMTGYTAEEAALIVRNNAARMGVELDEEFWAPVGEAAGRNPRVMRKILSQIRDLNHVLADTHPNLDKALRYAGRSADGLSIIARHMLMELAVAKGYTLSEATIGKKLGDPGDLRHEERVLLDKDLIEITGQGRRLTSAGIRRARQEFGS